MRKSNSLTKKLINSFLSDYENEAYFIAPLFLSSSWWEKTMYKETFLVKVKNYSYLKKLLLFLKSFSINPTLYKMETKTRKIREFILEIEKFSEDFRAFLNKFQLHYWQEKDFSCFLKAQSQKQDFLKGIFAASGYIQNFQKGYLIEFYFQNELMARAFLDFFKQDLQGLKLRKKRQVWIVFIQTKDGIEKFLSFTGAQDELFAFLDHAIIKEIKASVNRKLNFELANFERINQSYLEFKEIYDFFIQNGGDIESLPSKMKEAVKIRISYPELSLSQLVEKAVLIKSKSTFNYWLREFKKRVKNLCSN
jgi:DNA-binding protein WhiA